MALADGPEEEAFIFYNSCNIGVTNFPLPCIVCLSGYDPNLETPGHLPLQLQAACARSAASLRSWHACSDPGNGVLGPPLCPHEKNPSFQSEYHARDQGHYLPLQTYDWHER